MDAADGRIKADHLVIDLDPLPLETTQNIKLYNQATLPQKIRDWLVVGLSAISLFASISSLATANGLVSPLLAK